MLPGYEQVVNNKYTPYIINFYFQITYPASCIVINRRTYKSFFHSTLAIFAEVKDTFKLCTSDGVMKGLGGPRMTQQITKKHYE